MRIMLLRRAYDRSLQLARRGFTQARRRAKSIALLTSAVSGLVCEAESLAFPVSPFLAGANPRHYVTNAAQFRSLSGEDYLAGCDFQLSGVVTLVDTNRDLAVLQDATGAVAIHFRVTDQGEGRGENRALLVGRLVTFEGTNCCPYFASFPDFPYHPSGSEVLGLFEAPSNWGEYYLTRMRGWLRPPATGEYTFWIASDNSSELWLSSDADPSKARKVAFIPRFQWVNSGEWSRLPSQQSGSVLLKAGQAYYIEALQEQTTGGDHLAVAWQGPAIRQSVIDDRYLVPCAADRRTAALPTPGILREYWTNYSLGDLAGIGEARPFESTISVKEVRTRIHGPGPLPKPVRIALNQPLRAEDSFRWVEVEGVVRFATGTDGASAMLELSSGQSLVQVRASHWSQKLSKLVPNAPIRVEGVCEGATRSSATLVPGVIWATAENSISFIPSVATNTDPVASEPPAPSAAGTNAARLGFYLTRGVVTFNDRVFDNDYIFLQEDTAPVLITPGNPQLKSRLNLGQWAELGGELKPGKLLPVIDPLIVKELGFCPMPLPVVQPLGLAVPKSREGQWSELEGTVHSVNTNGTLSIVGKDGRAYFWIGQTPARDLSHYVDATLRARGVLVLSVLDAPLLLIPSRNFLAVEEDGPADPFAVPRRAIADLLPEVLESSWLHRTRVVGDVTYREARSFFLQDASGGIRVQTSEPSSAEVGQTVEVVGFATRSGFAHSLTEALVRGAPSGERVNPERLDLGEALSAKQSASLVQVTATLLARATNGARQVLELQQQQRVFTATLPAGHGDLPELVLGSRLRVTGVCDKEAASTAEAGDRPARAQFVASLNILLRDARDVAVLSGPPWWTWRRTATLVGALLTVLFVTLLWVHLLRRRLERQQAAQVAFSRNVLERLEEERRRIAANLHDSLGQMLLVIKSQAIWATQGAPEEPGWRERLDEIGTATSQAIEEVRRITHGLRPYQLDRVGLTLAIRTLVGRASENRSIVFASRVEDIDNLFDKDDEIHVYRIVQEAVTNIVKHSGATEATVVIKKRAALVALSIRDNGRGFDPAKPASPPQDLGYGLHGIAERVRILGGTLAIESRPGEGAITSVEIPLPHHHHDQGNHSFNRR